MGSMASHSPFKILFMTEAATIFQCENCGAYCDAEGNRFAQRPEKIGLPESILACQVCAVNPRNEEAMAWNQASAVTPALPREAWRHTNQSRKQKPVARAAKSKNPAAPAGDRPSCKSSRSDAMPECPRGMPKELDDERCQVPSARRQVPEERPIEVGAATDAESLTQNEWFLQELLKSFLLADATRSGTSRWISNAELLQVCTQQIPRGITRPNSRASQLNGSDTLEPHALMLEHRLFIECAGNPTGEGIARRLIFAENIEDASLREEVLRRYAKIAAERGQRQFTADDF